MTGCQNSLEHKKKFRPPTGGCCNRDRGCHQEKRSQERRGTHWAVWHLEGGGGSRPGRGGNVQQKGGKSRKKVEKKKHQKSRKKYQKSQTKAGKESERGPGGEGGL